MLQVLLDEFITSVAEEKAATEMTSDAGCGFGFRVSGSGFRVQGLGLRV